MNQKEKEKLREREENSRSTEEKLNSDIGVTELQNPKNEPVKWIERGREGENEFEPILCSKV